MDEDKDWSWHSTPQEHILDNIYEATYKANKGFVYDFFGVTVDRPEPLLYVKDPDGNCWKITAQPHVHKE